MNPRLGIAHLFSKLHLKRDSRTLALAQAHPRPALACEHSPRVQVKISENTYSCVIHLLQQASQIALDHANQSKTIYQRQRRCPRGSLVPREERECHEWFIRTQEERLYVKGQRAGCLYASGTRAGCSYTRGPLECQEDREGARCLRSYARGTLVRRNTSAQVKLL